MVEGEYHVEGVERREYLLIVILRETSEVHTSPRGMAEADVVQIRVEEVEDDLIALEFSDGRRYFVRREQLEAMAQL